MRLISGIAISLVASLALAVSVASSATAGSSKTATCWPRIAFITTVHPKQTQTVYIFGTCFGTGSPFSEADSPDFRIGMKPKNGRGAMPQKKTWTP